MGAAVLSPSIHRGLIAGAIATLVVSLLMLLEEALHLMPQMNVIVMLARVLGTQTLALGWLAHFIIGVVVWGIIFAIAASKSPFRQWLNGVLFGAVAWLLMMVLFMPAAGAGFFGTAVGAMTPVVTLAQHLIYGAVLGAVYGAGKSIRAEGVAL